LAVLAAMVVIWWLFGGYWDEISVTRALITKKYCFIIETFVDNPLIFN